MFEPGTQVGRYEIQRRLGRGGMGTVYAAHDPVLGRLVAIKVFAGDLDIPDARERFAREARSAAALAHPHIVATFDFGEYEAQPYIVMEYVAGETLAEVIRRKAPVALSDKLRWVEELAAGAGYAHQMSVIHRDIKPANLIIDRYGRLKILDFGIARMLGSASHTKDMIGTPGYMAPEQILGKPVDGRADVFSIGVVFYELLAYTEAFPGDTGPAITHRILTQDPVPLPRLIPDLNPALLPIIERALKKDVDERFADAEAFGAEVSRVRRRSENDSGAAVAPTILRPAAQRPTHGRPATGSAGLPLKDPVAVVTPPPDPKRTEELARRRMRQVEAALTQARAFLAVGELETALDACHQALTLDEGHVAAVELEGKIRVALAKREASALHDDAVESFDDELDEMPEPAAGRDAYAPTVLAPPRRTPAPLPPVPPPPVAPRPRKTAAPRTPPTPSLMARMRTATHAVTMRVRSATPAVTARLRAAAPAVKERVRALVPTRLPQVTRPVGRRATIAWASVAVVIVVAAVAAVVMLMPATIPPTGTLVIDAVPWGTVTAIEAANGERQPLPSPASTPLSISLPAGTYQVLVAGPTPESEAQRIGVTVAADAASVAPTVRFRAVTPEEYFEQYLAAPTAPAEAAVPPADAAPPAVPATPAGVSP